MGAQSLTASIMNKWIALALLACVATVSAAEKQAAEQTGALNQEESIGHGLIGGYSGYGGYGGYGLGYGSGGYGGYGYGRGYGGYGGYGYGRGYGGYGLGY